MALFEPTNYTQNNTSNDDLVYGTNRYRKTQPERQGFLKVDTQQVSNTAQAEANNTRDRYQSRRNDSTSRINTSQTQGTLTSMQKGISAYRENNALLGRNTQKVTAKTNTTLRTAAVQAADNEIVRNTATTVTAKATTASTLMNQAIQEYTNINTSATNTNLTLQRDAATYLKERRSIPLGAELLQTTLSSNQQTLAVPQTMNSVMSQGILQYALMNTAATDNGTALGKTADLYLKSNPMLQMESQLFV
ncbi:hypothetical protein LLG96_08745 [bacterium]|nr:hypothetical protein [bacterium]